VKRDRPPGVAELAIALLIVAVILAGVFWGWGFP